MHSSFSYFMDTFQDIDLVGELKLNANIVTEKLPIYMIF